MAPPEEGPAPVDQRPALGRFPWFALFRRARALRLLVFFDMAPRITAGWEPAARQ